MPARVFAILLASCLAGAPGHVARAQSESPSPAPLTAGMKSEVVEGLAECLIQQYVYEEDGKAMAALVIARHSEGRYDAFDDHASFARALQDDIRSVRDDVHLKLIPPGLDQPESEDQVSPPPDV